MTDKPHLAWEDAPDGGFRVQCPACAERGRPHADCGVCDGTAWVLVPSRPARMSGLDAEQRFRERIDALYPASYHTEATRERINQLKRDARGNRWCPECNDRTILGDAPACPDCVT